MKNLFICCLLCLMNLCLLSYGTEIHDVETLPTHRTKQYSDFKTSKKIIIFSPSRTGSSLIYNIFRFLFEDDSKLMGYHNEFDLERLVLKTHKFEESALVENEDVIYVFVHRNPLDACISNYRICTRKIDDRQLFAKQLINRHCRYVNYSENLEHKHRTLLRLRYEDFADNLDYIFGAIETHFNISIATEDKEIIRKGYSKKNIYLCTQHLTDFSESLPVSGFHGRHIMLEEYAPPEDFVYWLKIYLEDVKSLFQTYGYFLEI